MRLRILFFTVLLFSNASIVRAHNSYQPPATIRCSVVSGVAVCDGFNRRYLVEGKAGADTKEVEFIFQLGQASYSLRHTECMLNYLYVNAKNETVRLQSAKPYVRPDFDAGNWLALNDYEFVCRDGNAQCALSCTSC